MGTHTSGEEGRKERPHDPHSHRAQPRPSSPSHTPLPTHNATTPSSYVPEPVTPLHRVHARAKLMLLVATLLLSARSPPPARAALAAAVVGVTAALLPPRLAKPQLVRVGKVAAFLFVLTAIGAEGVPPMLQPRGAPADLVGLGGAPAVTPLRGGAGAAGAASASALGALLSYAAAAAPPYSYVVFHALFITITRRSLALATSAAATAVVALQGSSLCLTTTPAEEAALALCTLPAVPSWPRAGEAGPPDPVAGTAALTLLLSLRFLSLVFDEARGLALGLAARGIDWARLGPGGGLAIGARLVSRLFSNLEARAADIAVAMRARGFAGPGLHRVHVGSGGVAVSWGATAGAVVLALAALARAAVVSP